MVRGWVASSSLVLVLASTACVSTSEEEKKVPPELTVAEARAGFVPLCEQKREQDLAILMFLKSKAKNELELDSVACGDVFDALALTEQFEFYFAEEGASSPAKADEPIVVGLELVTFFPKLKKFAFGDNRLVIDNRYAVVRDLTPLAKLRHLEDIAIYNSTPSQGNVRASVIDLAPLAELRRLKILSLGNTALADLSTLAGLKQTLRMLDLHAVEIESLGGVEQLQRLEILSVRDAPGAQDNVANPLSGLGSLKPLNALPNLKILRLEFAGLTNDQLAELDPERLLELEGLDISRNKDITDAAHLAKFRPLKQLNVSETPIEEDPQLEMHTLTSHVSYGDVYDDIAFQIELP